MASSCPEQSFLCVDSLNVILIATYDQSCPAASVGHKKEGLSEKEDMFGRKRQELVLMRTNGRSCDGVNCLDDCCCLCRVTSLLLIWMKTLKIMCTSLLKGSDPLLQAQARSPVLNENSCVAFDLVFGSPIGY
jgi:hypothetical protein